MTTHANALEVRLLDLFWLCHSRVDHLELLQWFAKIVIARPETWDPGAIRAAASNHSLSATQCFGCRNGDRSRHWHHIIQVQHGGSNYLRNRVAVCPPCHAAIHPWLAEAPRVVSGFVQLRDIIPSVLALERARAKQVS